MGRLNTDLLLAIREQITTHPESHDQDTWAQQTECGTTYCIAGWACVLDGKEIDWGTSIYTDEPTTGYLAGGARIDMTAVGLLGLDIEEASQLFYARDEDAPKVLDALIEKGKNGED